MSEDGRMSLELQRKTVADYRKCVKEVQKYRRIEKKLNKKLRLARELINNLEDLEFMVQNERQLYQKNIRTETKVK